VPRIGRPAAALLLVGWLWQGQDSNLCRQCRRFYRSHRRLPADPVPSPLAPIIFVSYTSADRAGSGWIAWQLEQRLPGDRAIAAASATTRVGWRGLRTTFVLSHLRATALTPRRLENSVDLPQVVEDGRLGQPISRKAPSGGRRGRMPSASSMPEDVNDSSLS
jgi:hypothetical protein